MGTRDKKRGIKKPRDVKGMLVNYEAKLILKGLIQKPFGGD